MLVGSDRNGDRMAANKALVFKFADVEVREREFSLVKAGEALPVEPKAFRVLLILLRNSQKLIPKEELLTAVWGDTAVSENSLARTITLLRRLLGDEARTPRFIETVATVGYRWICKVEVLDEAPAEADPTPQSPLPQRPLTQKSRKSWLLSTAAILVAALALAVWYVRRPLPPPRITGEYVQITHDGRTKQLVGTDGNRIYFAREFGRQPARMGPGSALIPTTHQY